MADYRQEGIHRLARESAASIRMADGTTAPPSTQRLKAAISSSGFEAPSFEANRWNNNAIGAPTPGGYFNPAEPNLLTGPNVMGPSLTEMPAETALIAEQPPPFMADNAMLNLSIPTGPLGQQWDINGSTVYNPYIPGTFFNSDLDAQTPVLVKGKVPPMSSANFRRRYLPGMDAAFSFIPADQFDSVYRYWWQVAVGDLESRIGQFILPRSIICDGIERGFRPFVDFDLEEREVDFNAREFYCQPAGTPVLTWYGTKAIEQVHVGDFVLTHGGVWASVLKAGSRGYLGDMYSIRIAGWHEPVRMTDGHRVWAARLEPTRRFTKKMSLCVSERFQEAAWGWVEAKDLRPDDIVSWPVDQTVLSDREILAHFTEACGEDAVSEVENVQKEATTGHIVGTSRVHRPLYPEEVGYALQPAFWRFVGYWLGEGSLHSSGVVFSFAKDEHAFVDDVTAITNMLLNRKATPQASPTTAGLRISCNASLGFFQGLYSTHDKKAQKRLLPWIERLPLEMQKQLLLGYWRADGFRTINGKTPNYGIGSVAVELLAAIQRIGARLGLVGNLIRCTSTRKFRTFKDGSTYAEQPYYTLWFGPEFGTLLLGTDEHRLRPSAMRRWIADGRVYAKIASVTHEPEDTDVFSFTVGHDDSSYTLPCMATHNSWGWMTTRYTPIMSILQMNIVYPTGQMVLGIPPSWIKPQMLSGQIRMVPPQGALSQVVLGPGGFLVMLMGGMILDIPAIIFLDYVAGMWPVPDILLHAISMQTAIQLFTLASDVLAQGQMRTVASLEGVIDEQREFTGDADKLAFAGRIRQYEREVNRVVKQWLGWSARPQLITL